MRKLLVSAAVIALFALPALAQDHDRGHGGGGDQQGGGPAPQAQGPQPQGGPSGGGDRGGDHGHPQGGQNPSFSRGPGGGNRPAITTNPGYNRGPGGGGFDHQQNANPNYMRGPNGGFNPGGPNRPAPGENAQGFNRGGQGFNRGGHHDFHGFPDFHQNFTAQRHFHAGFYRRPQGWYPHHWVFGEFLPAPFWARDYWLADYVDFGLPPPPYGAIWVRVGDDALLIDQDSGEIITVEYGVFY